MSRVPLGSRRLRAGIYAVVFAAALVGYVQRNGLSPVVHPDTAFELALAGECLRDDACTTLGGPASFADVYHMVGWLNFMVVAEWIGLGRDAIHVLIQVANAFGIVLVMLVADRLGGLGAAALAPYFAFRSGAAPGALYDSSLMAFFGGVLLVQCVAAATTRPPATLVVLATLVAAIITEVHLAGGLALLSVLWVVLLHPGGRVRRVALVALTFVAAVLVISPRGIVWDLGQLLARVGNGSSGSTSTADPFPLRLETARTTSYFLLPWLAHVLVRRWVGKPPRGLQGALAVAVPLFGAYAVGVLIGALPRTSFHYLEHGWPARAVVLAVPMATIAAVAWDAVTARVGIPASRRDAVLWIVPLLFSVHAAVTQPGPERPQARWADVQVLARLLHDDWQWDWPTVNSQVLSPEKQRLLTDLAVTMPEWEHEDSLVARRAPEPIAVIAVETRRVPDPLPREWIVLSRRTFYALLVIPTHSALDWDGHMACFDGPTNEETCVGPPVDPMVLSNLPVPPSEIRRFVRRVPWHGTAGAVERIVLPELPLSCVGRILRGPPGTEIDSSGRGARITQPGEVTFEWRPNTPGCGTWDFIKQDNPPFMFAGDPGTVDALGRLMLRHDGEDHP